ncbi:hypothetical protein J6590_068042 [Homalodisca vitripennis]|nr:hypothetical protein J6590_068042 [Homalodisca vitripennis]
MLETCGLCDRTFKVVVLDQALTFFFETSTGGILIKTIPIKENVVSTGEPEGIKDLWTGKEYSFRDTRKKDKKPRDDEDVNFPSFGRLVYPAAVHCNIDQEAFSFSQLVHKLHFTKREEKWSINKKFALTTMNTLKNSYFALGNIPKATQATLVTGITLHPKGVTRCS